MSRLPDTEDLLIERDGWVLRLTLNRPALRNALSTELRAALTQTFEAIRDDREIRAVVIRGAGGNFCAGGDIKGFGKGQDESRPADEADPFLVSNRLYGELLDAVNEAPQVVIAAIEGAVRGGGMGFTCTSDVAIATERASFGLPEATLGLPAAQVCVFVAERIGLTQTRMLASTGATFRAPEALARGLIHHVVADADALEAKVEEVLADVARCEPAAVAENKRLLHLAKRAGRTDVIEAAAQSFTGAMRGEAAKEGVAAFIEKRDAAWNQRA
ncbi:MAG: enoyl-CoA hydratase-related protein [Alphaproteobacteria bacterium]|jgi:isohexenylglutaconyl-CoA hydratase|nr:enoyl-CoA hydratase-related protein [Alphaproteobacteria bacterium]